MTETDAALLQRVLQGDASSYETLMRRHFRSAFAVALAHTGNHADAEDVCQMAFFRAYERLGDCEQPDRFAAWLMRIVRNRAINWQERQALRNTEPLFEATARSSDAPDLDLERAELRRELLAALGTLKPVQREVVLLHDLEGWTHPEIARVMSISAMMCRRHLSDARKVLRPLLARTDAGRRNG